MIPLNNVDSECCDKCKHEEKKVEAWREERTLKRKG